MILTFENYPSIDRIETGEGSLPKQIRKAKSSLPTLPYLLSYPSYVHKSLMYEIQAIAGGFYSSIHKPSLCRALGVVAAYVTI